MFYNEATFGFIQGGCQATTIVDITPPPNFSFYFPGTIQVNKAGQISIVDLVELAIGTFNPPVNDAFGPVLTVTPLTGSTEPVSFALLASGKDLYTADSGGSGFSREYAYPAGGAVENTIAAGGQPIGVAVSPPYLP
jgi:hypothetical protein